MNQQAEAVVEAGVVAGVDLANLPPTIEVLKLQPGDRILLTYPGRLRQDVRANLMRSWVGLLPGVKVIVIEDGPTIAVLRPEEATGG